MVNGKERSESGIRTTGTQLIIGETLFTQQVMDRTAAEASAVHRCLTCDTTTADRQLASSPSTNPAGVDLGQPWIVDLGKLFERHVSGFLVWMEETENFEIHQNLESIQKIIGGLREVLISTLRCHLNMT